MKTKRKLGKNLRKYVKETLENSGINGVRSRGFVIFEFMKGGLEFCFRKGLSKSVEQLKF